MKFFCAPLARLAVLLACVPMSMAAPAPANEPVLELSLSSQRLSDATTLAQLGAKGPPRLRPRSGVNLAYEDNEIRLAYTQGRWRMSAFGRQSAAIVASEDTLEMARLIIERQRPTDDRHFSLALDDSGYAGGGLALARAFGAATGERGWHADVELQALTVRRLRRIEVQGQVSYQASQQAYAFDAKGLRIQDTMHFPFQKDQPSSGTGLLAQLQVGWCEQAWCLNLTGRDLGQLRWRQMPQEEDVLSSNTQSYDEDGYLIYKPMLSGRYSQTHYRQSPRQRWTLQGHHDSRWGRAQLQLTHLQGFGWLPELGLNWAVSPGLLEQHLGLQRWGWRWAAHERRLSLDLQARRWRLSLGSDKLGSGSHARELSLAWVQPL